MRSVTKIAATGRWVLSGWSGSILAALVLATSVGTTAAPSTASAENIFWRFQNFTGRLVSVRFYSKSRNWVWPSRTRVYTVPATGRVYTMNLRCRYNEKVCYGAWPRGNRSRYWGVGPGARQGCANCCYRCTNIRTQIRRLR